MTPHKGPFIFVDAHSNTAPPLTLTEWYEADQLPVRSGVYDVGTEFRYFDGVNWYVGAGTPNEAMRFYQVLGERTTALPWRGLMERHT